VENIIILKFRLDIVMRELTKNEVELVTGGQIEIIVSVIVVGVAIVGGLGFVFGA
jgi:lactobin A/cerein 7B family class IIb bacteriocin